MATKKVIKIEDLLVNPENFRFDPVAGQKEAIDQMVEDQNDKLFVLAEHILKNGLNPNDRIQVIASNHDPSKYIVLEGNRRTVTLKILNHPDLIDNSKRTGLKRKIKKLREQNETKLITEVECTLYDDPDEANIWIRLKHSGQSNGVGTVDWNAQQVQRFDEKIEGKSSVALQTIKLLKTSPDVPEHLKNKLSKIPITNLDRLLSDPAVRSHLGIEINSGIMQSQIDATEVLKGLVQIITDLLDPKFTVKKIYTLEDRQDYIANFPKSSQPDITLKTPKPWHFNNPISLTTATSEVSSSTETTEPSITTTPSGPKTTINPKERKKLIPRSCVLHIDNPKLNNIYHELYKELDIEKHKNAIAVLFRVFVELSLDTYIEKHNLSPTVSSTSSGIGLKPKFDQVANHMSRNGLADPAFCRGIKTSIGDKNDILGIDTWHAYVHNNKVSPKSDNLITTWDNIQEFMIKLWENIK